MTWILTHTGRHFDYADPRPDAVCIEDVAHALAIEPRYNGHTRGPYSVAQHCCLLAQVAAKHHMPVLAYHLLHHDDSEAYLKDLPGPLKPLLPDYRAVEEMVDKAVHQAFKLDFTEHLPAIKAMDEALMWREMQLHHHHSAKALAEPRASELLSRAHRELPFEMVALVRELLVMDFGCWGWEVAERELLRMHAELHPR